MSEDKSTDKQLRHFIACIPFVIRFYKYYLQIFKRLEDKEIEAELQTFNTGIKRYVSFVSSYYKAQSKERTN